jgi:hypothetical protein
MVNVNSPPRTISSCEIHVRAIGFPFNLAD